MKRIRSTRILISVLALVAALLVSLACSTMENLQEPSAPPPAQPGEEVTLSTDVESEVIPQSVTQYGAGQYVTLSDLRLNKKGQTISGSMRFERLPDGENKELGLVVYVATPKRLLAIHYTDTQRLLVTAPPGQSGDVTFSLQGYEMKGDQAGSIEFEFATQTPGLYDLSGTRGTVFAYCVEIHEDNTSLSDVVSNVVKTAM